MKDKINKAIEKKEKDKQNIQQNLVVSTVKIAATVRKIKEGKK